jgi:amino acid permease
MSTTQPTEAKNDTDDGARTFLIGAVVGIAVLSVALVAIAVVLALNAEQAAPGVEVVRDLLIITMVLELVVIGAAVAVFLVQVARFVNLLNNEIQPIITSTQDTVNVVRGTAVFLSKNAVEPVVRVAAALRGIGSVLSNIDAISKAAGLGAAAAAAMSTTGERAESSTLPDEPCEPPAESDDPSLPVNRSTEGQHPGQSAFYHGFE